MAIEPFVLEGLEIVDAVSDGTGLARHNGRVVFVKGAIPGDVVTAYIYRKNKRYFQAELQAIERPSPDRVVPACKHFGMCGGCKWQQMRYSAQLSYKEKQVRDALERIGGLTLPEIRPIIGASPELGYRNKLEFTFAEKRWLTREQLSDASILKEPGMGFHVAGAFDKVLHLEECHLMPPAIDRIRQAAYDIARRQNLSFHDPKVHTGYLRSLVLRTAQDNQQLLVLLVVGEDRPTETTAFLDELAEHCPPDTSLMYTLNTKHNDVYAELPMVLHKGKGYLREQLEEFEFQISPVSFFQTNTKQSLALYRTVRDWLPEGKIPLLYDLYCGTGSIGIFCSHKAEHIVGLEFSDASIADAHLNAKLNNLSHLSFYAANLTKGIPEEVVKRHGTPDVLIADPPRAGMEGTIVQSLLALAPPTIIYVSCNVATQARDLQLLSSDYHIERVQPVDMFPQTTHAENIVLLRKLSS
jgi:23S rRNA (uracil1939-C5)-methyltransferase